MKRSRLITLAALAGVTSLAVAFLTAANTSNTTQPKQTSEAPKPVSGNGIVVFGNFDVEDGVIPLFPETFPQPTKVVQVLVKEGETVAAGTPLIKLDAELAGLTLEEAYEGLKTAESAVAGAKALLEQAKQVRDTQTIAQEAQQIAIDAKKQSLESARTKLVAQKLRAEREGIKNDSEIRAAEHTLESSQKDVEFEEKKLEGLKRVSSLPNINAAQSKVDEATSAVRRQSILVKKAEYGVRMLTIKAPSDGKILRSSCQVGLTVGAQTKQPLMWFQPAGNFIVRCEVDQEWSARVQKNQSAVVHDDNNNALTWKGHVAKISDTFLPKRSVAGLPEGFPMSETRVLEVLVELDKGENTTGLRIGQRVKVGIGTE